jgi:site-specific DNA-methyltransferase (cytosine-N4-specific)
MLKLLEDPDAFYSPKERPSGHDISKGFGKDNGGAIPSNLLSIPNSESNSLYLRGCKSVGLKGHPARFPAKLPEFFIKFLTDPGDLVVDIFAGSNTTGQVAESLGRRWLSIELDREYVAASVFRFIPPACNDVEIRRAYESVLGSDCLNVSAMEAQQRLFDEEPERGIRRIDDKEPTETLDAVR